MPRPLQLSRWAFWDKTGRGPLSRTILVFCWYLKCETRNRRGHGGGECAAAAEAVSVGTVGQDGILHPRPPTPLVSLTPCTHPTPYNLHSHSLHPAPRGGRGQCARPWSSSRNSPFACCAGQGYLAHEKQRPPRTLQWDYA